MKSSGLQSGLNEGPVEPLTEVQGVRVKSASCQPDQVLARGVGLSGANPVSATILASAIAAARSKPRSLAPRLTKVEGIAAAATRNVRGLNQLIEQSQTCCLLTFNHIAFKECPAMFAKIDDIG
jgi:hypothetical protein